MSEVLSRQQIFDAPDLAVEDVPVPEWPGADGEPGIVRLRQMNAGETIAMTDEMDKPENKSLGLFIILVHTAVDAGGALLFTSADVEALKKKNFGVLDRLQRRALAVNSGKADPKKA